jgi:hypothetical protein
MRRILFAGAAVLLMSLASNSAAQEICRGDCNNDGRVDVADLVGVIAIALGENAVENCRAGDRSDDGQVTVDEILTAVGDAVNGCPVPSSFREGLILCCATNNVPVCNFGRVGIETDCPTECARTTTCFCGSRSLSSYEGGCFASCTNGLVCIQ